MTGNPGFFATFFSLCRGTAEAPVLVRNPFWKVLLHFFLLCVLVSMLVATGQYTRMRRWLQDSETSFTGAFGPELVLRGNGIYPGNAEDKARSIVLPYKGRLCYAGSARHSDLVVTDLGGLQYLILWRDGRFLFAIRSAQDVWGVFRPGEKLASATVSGDRSALEMLFQETEPLPEKEDDAVRHVSVAALADVVRLTCWFVAFMQQFFDAFVLGIAATGAAALIFSIGSRRMLRGINLWKSALYAGFPAMAIAGCFPMFALPLFSYSQVYLFATFIYWIAVVRRVEITWQLESQNDSKGEFYDN